MDGRRCTAGCVALALLLGLGVPGTGRADPPHVTSAAAAGVARTAAAAPLVILRRGEHPGYTRLVFHLPGSAEARVQAEPDGLVVRVPGAAFDAGHPASVPEVSVEGDRATLRLPPHTHLRQLHLPGRLVLDLVPDADDAPGARPPPAAAAAPSMPPPMPKAAHAAPVVPAPAAAAMLPAAPAPAQVTAQPPAAAPAIVPAPTLPVTTTPLPASPPPAAKTVPSESAEAGLPVLAFAHGTGAAAFRSGAWAIAVFDQARTLDLDALHAMPGLATADVATLATATEIRLRLPSGQALGLEQQRGGWSLAVVAEPPPLRPIHPSVDHGGLDLPLDRPGRVVSVPDPETGGLLLVGTEAPAPLRALRAAAAQLAAGTIPPPDAQGIAVPRHSPLFALLGSWQGVAVAPGADDLVLRTTDSGFRLERATPGQTLALADADDSGRAAAAATFSRLFDLPDESLPQLVHRLTGAAGTAAGEPPEDRGPARLHAAEAMLALGMGAEASGLVRLAATDDARLSADPHARALAAASALLAGRLAETGDLDDPALLASDAGGSDEIALWRGLLAATRADRAQRPDPAAAEILATRLPLLQSYPQPLRDQLLPLALRTMVLGGETAAARRALAAAPHSPGLDYARALLAEQSGQSPAALGQMDRLSHDPDRDISARAAVRAVDIRLQAHAYSPREAADALDPLIYAWRGDGRELSVRLREAALRLTAGQPRQALALLREAADPVLAQGWPGQQARIAERLRATFAEAVSRDAGEPLPAFDFIALVQENADLMPAGALGQAVAERVADRLASLDLPDQAAAILARLVAQTPPGPARGTLGLRLAGLQVEQHDPQSALMTLSASTDPSLPPPMVAARTMLYARATAARGNLDAATGALRALGTPAATDLEATLLTEAGKWHQATAALVRLAQATLPAGGGALNGAQATLLLRLASAAAQAGETPVLAAIRDEELARVPPGKTADLLRMLTEGPIQTVADLPRADAEMTTARSALK